MTTIAREDSLLHDLPEPEQPRRRRLRRRPPGEKIPRREIAAFYAFISPWIIGFLVFTLIPMGASLYLSFTNWNSFQAPDFVGFANYVRMFTQDPVFWQSLLHTAYFAIVSVPLSLLIALFLANLLAKPIRGARIFRTIIYLPALVPLVAAAMIFQWLLAPDAGPINGFLSLFGIQGPSWLLDANWVIPAIILLTIWQVGAGTILLIAALQGVPIELYEAARIDGATRFQLFWRISVPMVTPILFFNLVTGVIGAFQVFSQVYILTGGGPDNASMMMVPYIYNNAFKFYHMGYASALAWILFIIVVAFTAIIIKTSKGWVFYETDVNR